MTTPHRRSTDKWVMKPIVIAFVVVTLIFLATLIGFAWVVTDVKQNSGNIKKLAASNRTLGKENSKRIKEIQASRIDSCKKTYEGIREVFSPFFPNPPKTQKQIDDLETFNTTINDLKKGCDAQTEPKPKVKGG